MLVELTGIRKRYGAVEANAGIDLTIEPGTIHGLLGENGAGKSTLMKILAGCVAADAGEVRLAGRPLQAASPAEAVQAGVGMLHQEPMDFPALSVLENLILGSGGFRPDRGAARRDLAEISGRCGFALDPDAAVISLSIGERQQLEIVRLLRLGARVLILDEPTTAISAAQRERLFAALRRLAAEGRTVIFVSHKLDEVAALCGRVTVLARGRVAGEAALPCPLEVLVRMMFGRTIAPAARPPACRGEPTLEVERLAVEDWQVRVRDFSLTVRAGEVVGLAGLEGNGQRLFLRAAAGLARLAAGRVRIAGADCSARPYAARLAAGIAFLPANRLEEGLVPGLTIAEHAALAARSRRFLVEWPEAIRVAGKRIATFAIKGEPETKVEELSGGNQQRVLLSLLPPRLALLLMEHPTRGLDLEAAEQVWSTLLDRAAAGTAIVFLSADLDELAARCDRILVFCGGRTREAERPFDSDRLGELIGGHEV